MSKPTRTVTHCEQCDGLIDLVSPPSPEHYKGGRIDIADGMVLLDVPDPANHAKSLAGYYCNVSCLTAFINKARGTPRKEEA